MRFTIVVKKGGGSWENLKKVPPRWTVHYQDMTFCIKQMGFKHTGLFPEQAVNWEFMMNKIKRSKRPIKVLNLFAYTGGATVACLSAGASVTHVDSSRGMVDWCKENVKASGLEGAPVRYLVDDVKKFVAREIRRGNHYDAIIMDPPSYGRGTNGEVWDIEKDLALLVSMCSQILVEKPLFFLINSYTTGLSSYVLKNLLSEVLLPRFPGKVRCGEVGILLCTLLWCYLVVFMVGGKMKLNILYEDNHLLVVEKPPFVLSQSDGE